MVVSMACCNVRSVPVRYYELWRRPVRVGGKTYALVGVVGFAIKHLLDWRITQHFLHNDSGLFFNYWAPLGIPVRLSELSQYQAKFLATLLAAAIPFIWLGLAMTVKRLRD